MSGQRKTTGKKYEVLPNGTAKASLPSGLAVIFRRPGPFTNAQALGAIPALASKPLVESEGRKAASKDEPVVLTVKDAAENRAFQAARFCLCSLGPKFTVTYPPERGRRHIDTLREKDFNAALDAFEAFSDESAEAAAIAPLDETREPSSRSTHSDAPTDADQALSSAAN